MFSLRVLPLVAENENDPGLELGERCWYVALTGLIEDGADEPQVEGVAGQREDVPDNNVYTTLLCTMLIHKNECTLNTKQLFYVKCQLCINFFIFSLSIPYFS
jgi:hypothetical protein